ncbi:MAG: Cysteine desulfurase IscS [Elusimicrobia bacterium]|nr:Cysteine desulfurase IscS [Elusimicrobiota bacterium]
MIYLDHNATTAIRSEAFEAMLPYLSENFGNASSLHQLGQRARKGIEEAREKIAKFIGADSADEIIFTSGGTESNNTILRGILETQKNKGRRIISSAIEHSAVRTPLQMMSDAGEIDSVVIPVQSNGIVRLSDLEEALTPDTILVSVMAANNEIGSLQPIQEISRICKKKNVLFHTDAVQLAGKHPVQVNELGIDFLSLSGHKFGSVKGVGVLYVRKGTRMAALIRGGKQEKNRRGGTENVPGIVSMGAAAEAARNDLPMESKRLKGIRDLFEELILAGLTHTSVNGDKERRICNTSNLCIEYTDGSEMLMALDLQGVACSTGSACQAGSADASHVLLAMGYPQEKAHASLRFSFGHSSTESDARSASKIIIETAHRLRDKHPLWRDLGRK